MQNVNWETKDSGVAFVAGDGLASAKGWTLTGYASLWDVPDLTGDVVRRHAFDDSLKKRQSVPILYSHDVARPIGKTVYLHPDARGLLFRATLVPTRLGEDARKLVEAGVMTGASIGYKAKKSGRTRIDGESYRTLESVSLFEISLVTFPALDPARLSLLGVTHDDVKDALQLADLEDEWLRIKTLAEIDTELQAIEYLQYGNRTEDQYFADVLAMITSG